MILAGSQGGSPPQKRCATSATTPFGARSTGGLWEAPWGSVAKVASAQASNQPLGIRPCLLVLRHAAHPAVEGRLARHRAIRAKLLGGGRRGLLRLPERRVEHQPVDALRVRLRVAGHDRRAPRPAQEVELVDPALLADVVHHRRHVAHRHVGRDDRLVGLGRLVHLLRPRRAAVAPDVHQVHVEAALGDEVHPRLAAERQVEGGLRRVGGAVHEEQRPLRPEARHALGVLVADVELDAGILRRNHRLLDGDPGRFRHRRDRGEQRGGERDGG